MPAAGCQSGDGSSVLAIQSASALVEIDTYNLTHEVQAPITGILSKVLVKDGGYVEAGTVVGTIDQV
jgi:pyruvate/2-oxoglutarate dehydrogenase complex dihydrolipoamide acyltransferase (E2) component